MAEKTDAQPQCKHCADSGPPRIVDSLGHRFIRHEYADWDCSTKTRYCQDEAFWIAAAEREALKPATGPKGEKTV